MSESSSTQRYSYVAYRAAYDGFKRGYTDYEGHVRDALDAAHDRQALGLDASVCARTHGLEIVRALLARLDEASLHDDTGDPHDEGYTAAQLEMRSWLNVLLREFEATGGRP